MSTLGLHHFSQLSDITNTAVVHERTLLGNLDSSFQNLTLNSTHGKFSTVKQSIHPLVKPKASGEQQHEKTLVEPVVATTAIADASNTTTTTITAVASIDTVVVSHQQQPTTATATKKVDDPWKSNCVELIEGMLYFSMYDLIDLRFNHAHTNFVGDPRSIHSLYNHSAVHMASQLPKSICSFALDGSDVLFVGLSANELIDQSWINTDYFGPLCLTQIFKWRNLFLSLNDPNATPICFFVHTKSPVSLLFSQRQNLRSEMLVNAVLLLSICMMLFVYPKEVDDDAVVSSIMNIINTQNFVKQMNQELCTFHAIDKTEQTVNLNDCLIGLTKAIQNNVLRLDTFDVKRTRKEKNKYDVSWMCDGKIAASCSPNCRSYFKTGVCPTLDEYVTYYKKNNILGVVRLNDALYERHHFIKNGIEHLDLPFMDGGVPSGDIVRTFIKFVEKINRKGGAVIVHCRGGIGRTGTLIGCFLMKEYQMTANECVAYLRLARPGSVSSLQHYYLKSVESDLLKMRDCSAEEWHTLPAPNSEVIRRSAIHTVLKSLDICADLSSPSAYSDHITLSFTQLMHIFCECRGSIMGGNKVVVQNIPFAHPGHLPFMEVVSVTEVKMPIRNFLYLVENIMTCGRMVVTESLTEQFKGKPIYH